MKKLNVYLTFTGDCEEALNFYKDCFGGEIISKMTYRESPIPAPEGYKDKLIHAEFRSDEVYLMACDAMPDMDIEYGNNITLSIGLNNVAEQQNVFNKLTQGGEVTMPLQETFWGARFGMLRDKFGIGWMLNCEARK
jgi:PhnB protein